MNYLNLTLTASDQVNIRGWFMFPSNNSNPKETPTIVYMHENAGNIGLRLPFYKYLINNLNVNILSMAYRGYSYSDPAKVNESGLKLDGEAINQFLKSVGDNSDQIS